MQWFLASLRSFIWALLLSPSVAFVVTLERNIDTNHYSSTFGKTNNKHINGNTHRPKKSSIHLSSNNDPFEQLSGNRAKAWQHAKKPLLRIGGKGATATHGNSLRQLLDQHTVVKVKVNTGPFDGELENAFDALKQLAVESGADDGMELIHIRTSDNTIMFGKVGALDSIDRGDFPPPPPPPREPREEATE